MGTYEVCGYGRDTKRKRRRAYCAKDEREAIALAEADGTVVEKVRFVPPRPATDRQKTYARDLGISFRENIDIDAMSLLINKALGNVDRIPASDDLRFQAWRLGIEFGDSVSEGRLTELITWYRQATAASVELPNPVAGTELGKVPDLCRAMRWVYSVCRHEAKAKWVTFADSGIDVRQVEAIARDLASNEKLIEQVWEQDEGFDDDYDDAAEARGLDPWNDDTCWFFFNSEGASSRIKAYRHVADLCRIHRA